MPRLLPSWLQIEMNPDVDDNFRERRRICSRRMTALLQLLAAGMDAAIFEQGQLNTVLTPIFAGHAVLLLGFGSSAVFS